MVINRWVDSPGAATSHGLKLMRKNSVAEVVPSAQQGQLLL